MSRRRPLAFRGDIGGDFLRLPGIERLPQRQQSDDATATVDAKFHTPEFLQYTAILIRFPQQFTAEQPQ